MFLYVKSQLSNECLFILSNYLEYIDQNFVLIRKDLGVIAMFIRKMNEKGEINVKSMMILMDEKFKLVLNDTYIMVECTIWSVSRFLHVQEY